MMFSESQNNNGYSEMNPIDFSCVLSQLSKTQREKLVAGYNVKNLEKVFNDAGIMNTLDVFLKNGMNVSRTARILYMHRNTLMYKLGSIKRLTGLDLKDFDMAVTFKILHTVYALR